MALLPEMPEMATVPAAEVEDAQRRLPGEVFAEPSFLPAVSVLGRPATLQLFEPLAAAVAFPPLDVRPVGNRIALWHHAIRRRLTSLGVPHLLLPHESAVR